MHPPSWPRAFRYALPILSVADPLADSAIASLVSSSSESRAMSGAVVLVLERAERLDALGEAAERPALVAALLRHRPQRQRRLGDHPERALGADDQLAQDGPAAVPGNGFTTISPDGVVQLRPTTSLSSRP